MKKLHLPLLLLVFPMYLLGGEDAEKEAVIRVIQTAYVDGLQNKGPVKDVEAGFHPGFELLGIRNNELTKWPIYSWIQVHENRLKENPSPPAPEEMVTAKYPLLDITGNAAIVKVELFRAGNLIFTDYLSLYKFDDGWKIVNKIYFRHPQETDK